MGLAVHILERLHWRERRAKQAHISEKEKKRVALVGSPNVGKSVLFHRLTGAYVTVSNYPGTTVEVYRAMGTIREEAFEFIDTPGMYSLLPITEEERVARSILLRESPDLILHVVDAKNLERMLPLTLQLLETGLPVILVLNIMDEAERLGVRFDLSALRKNLRIPVIATVSTTGQGIEELKRAILEAPRGSHPSHVHYEGPLEELLGRVEAMLEGAYPISRRSLVALLLQGDHEATALAAEKERDFPQIASLLEGLKSRFPHPISYELALARQRLASRLVREAAGFSPGVAQGWVEWLSRRMISPWTGIPILLAVLYYGVYWFVGDFGAGVLVDFLEGTLFEENINPWVTDLVVSVLPWKPLQDLLVGEYGVITLGFGTRLP